MPRKKEEAPAATHTNSIGMEFVLIPAGKFWMGSADDDIYAYDNGKPRHAERGATGREAFLLLCLPNMKIIKPNLSLYLMTH